MTTDLNRSPPQHTALPWHYDHQTTEIYIPDDDNEPCDVIADMETFKTPLDKAHANGEFIARACNSHYDLIAALEDLKGDRPEVLGGVCQHCGRNYLSGDDLEILEGDCPSDDCPAYIARTAIAKARGQQ